jgi:hypothetical protein
VEVAEAVQVVEVGVVLVAEADLMEVVLAEVGN